jgi:tRNA (guanine-N7-)-methyltransferase
MEIHSKYYGRKNARSLRPDDKDLYAEFYPTVQFNGTGDVLEIGFGMGDFLVHQALLHPESTFIGVEPFKTGLVSLLRKIKQHNIQNIRIYHGVVHDIIDKLPLLSAIYILYPDPWPKKRHHKRRLIQKEFLLKLHQHLKPEGKICIASDHEDYQQWIEAVLQDTWGIEGVSDQPFKDWIPTKYEKRAKEEGRTPRYYSIGFEHE